MKHLLIYGVLLAILSSCASLSKKAEDKFASAEYETAIQLYKKQLTKGKDKNLLNFKIGEAYRLSNRPKMALPFYKEAINGGYQDDKLQFYYGYALKANEEYEAAAAQFEKYAKTGANEELIRRAGQEVNNLKLVADIRKEETFTTIKNCDAVNTPSAEYSPMMLDKKLVFASSRRREKVFETTGGGFDDLYVFEFTDTANCAGSLVPFFGDVVNPPGIHDASATFSRDGKTMIFARSNEGAKNEARKDVDLFSSKYNESEKQWQEPILLDRVSKGDTIWDASPALSPDGKTLYFASNRREDSYGGVDIYKAERDANGVWGKVTNAGKPINTEGNDAFPYIAPNGKFFFASDGHPGLGGLDLFVLDTAKTKNNEITVKSLGTPINSSADDFGITYRNRDDGYFTSNRTTDNAKGDDDIYAFHNDSLNIKKVTYYLQGVAYATDPTKPERGQSALGGVTLQLLDDKGTALDSATSDETGKFKFKIALTIDKNYTVTAVREAYINTQEAFSTVGKGVKDVSKLPKRENEIWFDTKLVLNRNIFVPLDREKDKGKPPVIPEIEILYDYDSDVITAQSAASLDGFTEFLDEYFAQFPTHVIELGSHTDSRGSDVYNMKLSQRRAASAVKYIVSKGIAQERIVAKGYGETSPKIKKPKNEAEHHQNRRTTVRVLKQ